MMFFKCWKNISLVTLLLFFYLCIPKPLSAQSINFGRYYALLIGNQNYKHPEDWPKLTTPHNDVRALKKTLKNKYEFQIDVLLDATRDQIIDRLEAFKEIDEKYDNLLIYYAGHGKKRKDGSYWIGIDAQKNSSSKWLHFQTISGLINRRNAITTRHVLIIADSCYAGAIFRGDSGIVSNNKEEDWAWLLKTNNTPSRTALTSGGIESVLDTPADLSSNTSVFATEIVDQLKFNDDALSGKRLHQLIQKDVYLNARLLLNQNIAQTPEYNFIPGIGHIGGDFIFIPSGKIITAPLGTRMHHPGITRKNKHSSQGLFAYMQGLFGNKIITITDSVGSASGDMISKRMVGWITDSASASVDVAKTPNFQPQSIKKLAVIMKPDRRYKYKDVPYRRVEDIFMFDLLNKGYQVASRSDVKQVMEELHFQDSSLTENRIAKIGRMLNVSAMLIVSVTDLDYERQQSGSNYVSAALGARLIGVEKAEFLWGGRCSGTGSQIGSTLEDLAEKISKAFPLKSSR